MDPTSWSTLDSAMRVMLSTSSSDGKSLTGGKLLNPQGTIDHEAIADLAQDQMDRTHATGALPDYHSLAAAEQDGSFLEQLPS